MIADYTLKLKEEIPLLFNNKMLKDYSRFKGWEYEDLERAVISGKAFGVNDISDLLLIAHRTWCLYNNRECTKTEPDACAWLDEVDVITTEVIAEVFLIFAAKVFRTTPEKLKQNMTPVVSGGEEKKSLTAVA